MISWAVAITNAMIAFFMSAASVFFRQQHRAVCAAVDDPNGNPGNGSLDSRDEVKPASLRLLLALAHLLYGFSVSVAYRYLEKLQVI